MYSYSGNWWLEAMISKKKERHFGTLALETELWWFSTAARTKFLQLCYMANFSSLVDGDDLHYHGFGYGLPACMISMCCSRLRYIINITLPSWHKSCRKKIVYILSGAHNLTRTGNSTRFSYPSDSNACTTLRHVYTPMAQVRRPRHTNPPLSNYHPWH